MNKYLSNSVWMFIEKVGRLGLNFIFFGLIAKQLGTNEFGSLSFALTLSTMFLTVTNLGFDIILVKEFSNDDAARDKIFTNAAVMRLIATLFVFICASIYVIYFMSTKDRYIYIISFLSLFLYIQTNYNSFYQSKSKSKLVTNINLFGFCISSLYKIYILMNHGTSIEFAISFLIDLIVGFILLIFISEHNRIIKFRLIQFNYIYCKSLLKQSWPMVLSSVMIVLYTRLDQVMIMNMMGSADVAIFNVAIRISDSYLIVPSLLAASFYPYITKNVNKENLQFYFDIIFISALVTASLVLVLSPYIIPILFGPEYIKAIYVTNITVFSSLFSCLGGATTNYLIIINKSYLRIYRTIIGLFINIILNFFWIPKYGMIGAAYASLISQIFASWLSNLSSKHSFICFQCQCRSIFMLGSSSRHIYSSFLNLSKKINR